VSTWRAVNQNCEICRWREIGPFASAGCAYAIQDPLATNQIFGAISQAARPTAPTFPTMKRKTANIDIRVEPELVEKIDA
jgi:hypothetical protein